MTTRTLRRHALHLDYCPARLQIQSDDASALDWLAEFLRPSFDFGAPGTDDYSIDFDTDSVASAQLARQAAKGVATDCFSNDGQFSRAVSWTDAAGSRIVSFGAAGPFLRVPTIGSKLQLFATDDRDRNRLTLMRIVRELATLAHWQRRRLLLHGAAFESEGAATVVCGPKHSGKTTLLMHALAGGSRLIANDRAIVDPTGTAATIRGMPTMVSIREPTLAYFPDFAEQCAAARYDCVRTIAECRSAQRDDSERWTLPNLSGVQLCRLLGTTAIQSAPLAKVLFASVKPEARGAELIRLSPNEAAERLAENLLAPCRPLRWPSVFQRFTASAPPSDEELASRCRQLAEQLPCYRCLLGPDAYRSAVPWARKPCPEPPDLRGHGRFAQHRF